MWQAFEELQPYITGLVLTATQRSQLKEKFENWGRAFVNAFGKEHVTHYIVSTMFQNSIINAFKNRDFSTYFLLLTYF